MLPAGSPTPEHSQLQAWAAQHLEAPLAAFPHATPVPRAAQVSAGTGGIREPGWPHALSCVAGAVAACLAGEGTPLVVTDACAGWPDTLSIASLVSAHAGEEVAVNDRAPARHADAARPQRTLRVTVAQYAAHLAATPPLPRQASPPYYLNGWRAAAAVPAPYFLRAVDATEAILTHLDAALFKAPTAPPASPWWTGIAAALQKLFLGPAGCTTRLHFDAGDAHGYLLQLQGAKLVVLYPPSDAPLLRRLATESETPQSGCDPLAPPGSPDAVPAAARTHVALLRPGEALVIPRRWWHYAAALEPSLTAQRNFYSGENAAGLVELVMAKLGVRRR